MLSHSPYYVSKYTPRIKDSVKKINYEYNYSFILHAYEINKYLAKIHSFQNFEKNYSLLFMNLLNSKWIIYSLWTE